MLHVLRRVDMPADRSFRLYPHEHTMWEHENPIWKSPSEVGNELNTFPTHGLCSLSEITLHLGLQLVFLTCRSYHLLLFQLMEQSQTVEAQGFQPIFKPLFQTKPIFL